MYSVKQLRLVDFSIIASLKGPFLILGAPGLFYFVVFSLQILLYLFKANSYLILYTVCYDHFYRMLSINGFYI